MDDDDAAYNPFSSSHVWNQTASNDGLGTHESALFAPVELDINSIRFDHPYAPKHDLDRELRLPDLDTFDFGPLPELDSLDESSIAIDTPPLEPEEDIWEVALELGPANKDVLFYTWESFEKGEHIASGTPYVSEHGPKAFDAALAHDTAKLPAGRVIRSNILIQSLWNLGLGRSSILFQFNYTLKSFEPTIADGRPSGTSLLAAQSLIGRFVHIGNTFLYLRAFVERTFTSAKSIPARVALATSISSLLETLESHLGGQSRKISSLLQLQRLFARPREILIHVARMTDSVKHAKTNEQLASILHHRILEVEESDGYLRQISGNILSHVAEPTLHLIGEWIGIREEQGPLPIHQRGSFVSVEDDTPEQGPLEYVYQSEMMPRFITPEDGNLIFDTGNSLRFLKTQHLDHPLSNLDKFDVQAPELEWGFAWQDIESVATKAKIYEEALRSTILELTQKKEAARPKSSRSFDVPTNRPADQHSSDLESYFEKSIKEMNAQPGLFKRGLPDDLHNLLEDILAHQMKPDSNTFAPPLSITSALSFRPLITAQAKLVNAATLRLFFRAHQLRHHLSLQRQYHLLGDGVFSSLLASALFDPDRESAERHKGKMRSGVQMGLQLGSRTAWPPASSELRLALRGVLSESYYTSALYRSSLAADLAPAASTTITGRDTDSLPGQLNFAIRNLTEAEQTLVMDPDALPALDFLRLQYVPPPPLHLVLTTASLDKYDTIFKSLLRLARTLFVVSHLPRQYANLTACKFRSEAHHFVTTYTNYVFQSGIAEHWDEFEDFVFTLERKLDEEDKAGELGVRVTEGVSTLRDAHEKCLDSIMFSLLLRRRQRKVVALVDEIFEFVLAFAKLQRSEANGDEGSATVEELYAKLRGKIRVFLSVCRGLTGKKGYGQKGTTEENSIERLVVAMEMNGYFAS
ncbi:Spc98 family-domain-containing protein [Boeremia exigua]|uniref:Spc98 family-domain-containing protein n=1 Tax=Boeremia exigua TaxID=749465 RepID=UPI001E8CACF8|nr:Spc98 family-domain-containing protein [Boeremia exigua]KAH6629528.1 Spc98 family-domain-containing protein [Boeremia exigua]